MSPMEIPFRKDYPPRNDVVFSIMFGNIDLFSALLKAVTGHTLKAKEIISQASVTPDNVEHNYIRFDTFAKDENGTIYSMDMQNTYSEVLIKNRTIYYACRSVAGQTVKKGEYDKLNKVVVSFVMTNKSNILPIEIIKLYNQNNELYTDLFTLYNVYIPTVNRSNEIDENLKIFSEFFAVTDESKMEQFIVSHCNNSLGKRLISLYSEVICRKDLSFIQEGEYFDMKISEQDIMEAKIEAREKGLAEGLAEGREAGRAEGRAIGHAEGRAEGRAEGILTTLISLVKDGILTLTDAANRANMTVSEFESKSGLKA